MNQILPRRSVMLTLFLAVLWTNTANAQLYLPDSRSVALMGNRSLIGDVVEMIENRNTGIPLVSVNRIQLDYLQPFLSKLTSSFQISYSKQIGNTSYGIASFHQGTPIFQTTGLQLAVQKQLLSGLSAGVMTGIQRSSGIEMEASWLPLLNIHLYSKISEHFSSGIFISNPIATQSGTNQWSIRYPELKIGLAYQFKPQIHLYNEITASNGSKLSLTNSIRYSAEKKLQIMGGIRWNDFSFSAGFVYRFEKLSLYLSWHQHALPASSPASSFVYHWPL